jgi:hypothetical protein
MSGESTIPECEEKSDISMPDWFGNSMSDEHDMFGVEAEYFTFIFDSWYSYLPEIFIFKLV